MGCATRKMGGTCSRGQTFALLRIDISGPHNVTANGNKYILVILDYFTKCVEAYPMRNLEVRTVAEILIQEFNSRMGIPMIIHSN